MDNTQFPPPGTVAGTPARAPTATILQALPVDSAPPPLLPEAGQHKRSEGRVTQQDTARAEVTIATPAGNVVLRPAPPLSADSEVVIDIYIDKNQLRANLTVLRARQAEDRAVQDIRPQKPEAPPPAASALARSVSAGDIFTAIVIARAAPTDAPEQSTAASPTPQSPLPTMAEIVSVVSKIPPLHLALLPGPPPLPPALLQQIALSPDKAAALQSLPPAETDKLIAYAARPDVKARLIQLLPPGTPLPASLTPAAVIPQPAEAAQPQPAPADAETADSNLWQIARAQLSARVTQAQMATPPTPETAAAPKPPLLPVLQGLMNLMQGMERQVDAPADAGMADPLLSRALSQQMTQLMLAQNSGAPPLPLSGDEAAENPLRQIRILATASPGQPLPAPADREAAITGRVSAITPAGLPVVTTPEAEFVINTKDSLPLDTQVSFTQKPATITDIATGLMPQGAVMPGVATVPPALSFDPLKSFDWPALQETVSVLSAAAQSAAALIKNTLPAATPTRLPATALFFLAALRTGMVESWLGDTILQSLRQQGRKDLADRLGGDFARISQQSKTTVAGDWRVISMPLLHDEQVSQVQILVRQQTRDEDEKDKQAGDERPATRFVVTLKLTRMGDVQLDGLMHKKRLDFILRTQDALPASMRQEMLQRYAAALEQTQLEGGISFQIRAQSWISPGETQAPLHTEI